MTSKPVPTTVPSRADPVRRRTARPRESDLTTVSQHGTRRPSLPHEQDESSDSQTAGEAQREVGKRAHDDVAAGRVDTDRGSVTDPVYRRLKRP